MVWGLALVLLLFYSFITCSLDLHVLTWRQGSCTSQAGMQENWLRQVCGLAAGWLPGGSPPGVGW